MTAAEMVKQAANGNANAENFALAWINFCHCIDDLIDDDRLVSSEAVAAILVTFMVELSGNPFYQANKPMLLGIMVQSINSWLDSNTEAGIKRAVLAGMYHEVIYHIAFLTGGWTKLRTLTSSEREYKGES